jgi:acyl dehydratase
MNHFTFEEIEVGKTVTLEYDLTKQKMSKFLEITGDINPLHCDLDYAKEKGYSENVVYGMLTASILSTLAGVYLPGEHSLIHSVEISFVKPVFLSRCPLKINAEVIDKDERFSQITVKYVILDQSDSKVCKGIMKIGFTE